MRIATRITWLPVTLAISLLGASASADNWPQWRGPAGTGASSESESGETLVLRAGRTPEVLARNRINGRVLASPAISGGRIFIRTDDHVVAVGR